MSAALEDNNNFGVKIFNSAFSQTTVYQVYVYSLKYCICICSVFSMCLYVHVNTVCMCACACVCHWPMIWAPYNWLNKFYNFYINLLYWVSGRIILVLWVMHWKTLETISWRKKHSTSEYRYLLPMQWRVNLYIKHLYIF